MNAFEHAFHDIFHDASNVAFDDVAPCRSSVLSFRFAALEANLTGYSVRVGPPTQ